MLRLFSVLSLVLGLSANPAWAQLKIGVAGPFTGRDASSGAQIAKGVEQAVEDVNNSGGVLGKQITLERGDDASEPGKGALAAARLASHGVKFVVGHFDSDVTLSASKIYARNGVLFITPSATNPVLTEQGLWNAFRACSRDDQQSKLWAELAVGKLKDKKIAILHDKGAYGQGIADAARAAMNAAGKKEVLYEAVDANQDDYFDIVSKIRAAGADYVMWGGEAREGALILRQMRNGGVEADMVAGDSLATDDFASIAGPAVDGTLMSFAPDWRHDPATKDVVAKFQAKGFEPDGYTLYAYASVQIIKQAVETAQSLDPKKVADVMHSGAPFHTVIGDIAFDKKGDRTSADFAWYEWLKGDDQAFDYFVADPSETQ
jgi:branched-chain amino acid transport system substrate-binding protein